MTPQQVSMELRRQLSRGGSTRTDRSYGPTPSEVGKAQDALWGPAGSPLSSADAMSVTTERVDTNTTASLGKDDDMGASKTVSQAPLPLPATNTSTFGVGALGNRRPSAPATEIAAGDALTATSTSTKTSPSSTMPVHVTAPGATAAQKRADHSVGLPTRGGAAAAAAPPPSSATQSASSSRKALPTTPTGTASRSGRQAPRTPLAPPGARPSVRRSSHSPHAAPPVPTAAVPRRTSLIAGSDAGSTGSRAGSRGGAAAAAAPPGRTRPGSQSTPGHAQPTRPLSGVGSTVSTASRPRQPTARSPRAATRR